MCNRKQLLYLAIALIVGMLPFTGAYAVTNTFVTLSSIQANIAVSVTQIAKMLQDLSLACGIGFILSSFFKFHQHKLNPTQIPLSQGLSLLIIGGCLTMFPLFIPLAGSTLLGASANISHVSGSGIANLIGTAY